MKCYSCGTEFEGRYCPNCGTSANQSASYFSETYGNKSSYPEAEKKSVKKKQKKPFYKKLIFIIVVALVLIGVIGNISSETKDNKTEKNKWSETELGVPSNTPDSSDETEEDTTTTTTTTATMTTAKKTEKASSNGLRPDFQKAMDSYEDFMNEYVAFMKKYEKSGGTDLSLLTEYATYISKYSEMCADFEKWDEEDMNNGELAYYIDVQARVQKKLLELS